jgi:hypothetical protein
VSGFSPARPVVPFSPTLCQIGSGSKPRNAVLLPALLSCQGRLLVNVLPLCFPAYSVPIAATRSFVGRYTNPEPASPASGASLLGQTLNSMTPSYEGCGGLVLPLVRLCSPLVGSVVKACPALAGRSVRPLRAVRFGPFRSALAGRSVRARGAMLQPASGSVRLVPPFVVRFVRADVRPCPYVLSAVVTRCKGANGKILGQRAVRPADHSGTVPKLRNR